MMTRACDGWGEFPGAWAHRVALARTVFLCYKVTVREFSKYNFPNKLNALLEFQESYLKSTLDLYCKYNNFKIMTPEISWGKLYSI